MGTSGLSISKKADFVLAFSDDAEEVRTVYDKFKLGNPGATLSPMTDAYTSQVALACAIELEGADGNATEAEMRLAV